MLPHRGPNTVKTVLVHFKARKKVIWGTFITTVSSHRKCSANCGVFDYSVIKLFFSTEHYQQKLSGLILYEHIKTAEQRTIVQQYGDWCTGRCWVGCYIWYSEEGPGWAVPSSLYQMWQPTYQWPVYQLRIIWCGTIIASGLKMINRLSAVTEISNVCLQLYNLTTDWQSTKYLGCTLSYF